MTRDARADGQFEDAAVGDDSRIQEHAIMRSEAHICQLARQIAVNSSPARQEHLGALPTNSSAILCNLLQPCQCSFGDHKFVPLLIAPDSPKFEMGYRVYCFSCRGYRSSPCQLVPTRQAFYGSYAAFPGEHTPRFESSRLSKNTVLSLAVAPKHPTIFYK